MKYKFMPVFIITAIIVILSVLNIYQYFKFENYQKKYKEKADSEFKLDMQIIYAGIENISSAEIGQIPSLTQLSSGTSKADAICEYTSYYDKNKLLKNTLWELNNNITNRTNIEEVVKKNDLTILLPTLKKIIENPLDEVSTKELYRLVQKHTVLGSTVP
ncbi:hypothetical protein JHL18_23575 [Clostridium sp. YIM B02505]|uniref:Uncharacterized protein n=1 Tax=Clostridium yunnanense TaxID=2800325 RepID=A0ABS1EW43_9CLOT|nr:hypothetical protein [Clostridium yunnanense]MBK1813601.1 hypothetical protein [Clostridium yunnanense]